jgi:hypothetical protein
VRDLLEQRFEEFVRVTEEFLRIDYDTFFKVHDTVVRKDTLIIIPGRNISEENI